MRKECVNCNSHRKFRPFKEGLYKYNGERVYTCKDCGHLRTQNERRIIEAEMIHRPSQTKYKNMDKGDK